MTKTGKRRETVWRGSSLRSQLVRGGAGGLVARAVEMMLGFLVVILLARILGVDGYGVYAFLIAMVSLAAAPARMGLPILIVRETARSQVVGDWAAVRGIWRWAIGMALGVSVLAIGAGLLAFWAGWPREETLRLPFIWALLLVPFLALITLPGAALRGLGHVLVALVPDQLVRPLLMVGLLLIVMAWPNAELDPVGALLLTLGALVVSMVVGNWLLRQLSPADVSSVAPVYRHRTWMMAVWPMALGQGFQQINTHLDVILLGLLTSAPDVGLYRVAVQGAAVVPIGLMVLNMAAAPFVTRLHADGNLSKLQKLVARLAQAALAFAAPATLLFFAFGDWLLVTLFGDEFRGAYWPLVVLAIGQLVNAGFGPTGMLLNMTGHEREVTRAVAVAAGLNVVLNLVLIPSFGVIGAAIATSASLVFWNVWLWLVARWRLGVRCSAF